MGDLTAVTPQKSAILAQNLLRPCSSSTPRWVSLSALKENLENPVEKCNATTSIHAAFSLKGHERRKNSSGGVNRE